MVFYGEVAAVGERPGRGGPTPDRPDRGDTSRRAWTFAVERVAQGEVAGPEVVVLGSGSNCDWHYLSGRPRGVARVEQDGNLVADWTRYLEVGAVLPRGWFRPQDPAPWAAEDFLTP